MAISDLIIQVIKFLPVLATLIALLAIFSSFMAPTGIEISSSVNDLCSSENGLTVLTDINYDERTSMIQFISSSETDMSLTYPRNTYLILDSIFDDEQGNLGEAVNTMQGLFNNRLNSRFLETCHDNVCFCIVRTGMSFLTYEYSDYTACFPRLYTYAREEFDEYFNLNENPEYPDISNFILTVQGVLEILREDTNSEAQKIVECYDWFRTYDAYYEGVEGEYFLTADYNGQNNIIQDPSFETPSRYYEGGILLTDWRHSAHTGDYSMPLGNNYSDEYELYIDPYYLEPGQEYTIKAWIYLIPGFETCKNYVYLNLSFADGADDFNINPITPITEYDEWTEVSYEFTVPADRGLVTQAVWYIDHDDDCFTVRHMDDISIRSSSPSILTQESYDYYNLLTSFYDTNLAGLFSEVLTCNAIPNEDSCVCPLISQFMVSQDETIQPGVFLGIAGSKTYDNTISDLSINTLIMSLEQEPNACLVNVRSGGVD
jgi:hypothetical protein